MCADGMTVLCAGRSKVLVDYTGVTFYRYLLLLFDYVSAESTFDPVCHTKFGTGCCIPLNWNGAAFFFGKDLFI